MEDNERSEGTFRYTVQNIHNLKDAALSLPCYVRGLPWKIKTRQYPRYLPYHQLQKCLGFFVQCNAHSPSTTWSCYARAELRLISHKPNCEPFIRRIQHLFRSEENDWGYAHFLPWYDVLDSARGYIKDDAITLEVRVTADAPHGVSWTPKILDMPNSLYKTRQRKVQKMELKPIKEEQKATTRNKKKNKTNVSLRLPRRKISKTARTTKKMASGKTKKTKNFKTTENPKYFCLVCGDPMILL